MLHMVSGDILLSKAQAIAHGIAPHDDFHHGLALALREKWPAMAKDFRHWCHNSHPEAGTLWAWGGAGGARIVCLLTQDPPRSSGQHPGAARIEHVNHALKALHQFVEKEGIRSLALPRLATGVGGLKWDDILPLIQKHLGQLKIPIYVYSEYHAGVAAKEPVPH